MYIVSNSYVLRTGIGVRLIILLVFNALVSLFYQLIFTIFNLLVLASASAVANPLDCLTEDLLTLAYTSPRCTDTSTFVVCEDE